MSFTYKTISAQVSAKSFWNMTLSKKDILKTVVR
jgi:hypothetical protein